MENLFSQEKAKALPQNLQKLLLQGKKAEALRLLEKQIESDNSIEKEKYAVNSLETNKNKSKINRKRSRFKTYSKRRRCK